jgi:hypothetical protein
MLGCIQKALLIFFVLGLVPAYAITSHTESANPTPAPQMGYFTADTTVIPAGGCVTLSWDYPAAVAAELRGSNWPVDTVEKVESAGSVQTCPSAAANYVPDQPVAYVLTAYFADGHNESTTITISYTTIISTPTPILPPTVVPYPTNTPDLLTPVASLEAHYQEFEHGFMLQIVGENCAYAFSIQAKSIIIPAVIASQEGGIYHYCLPLNTVSIVQPVPDGLLLPSDSFLPVWGGYAEVQGGLGFATAPEIIYAAQPAHDDPVVMGGIFYIGIITLPDGRELRCGHRGATAGTCTIQ